MPCDPNPALSRMQGEAMVDSEALQRSEMASSASIYQLENKEKP